MQCTLITRQVGRTVQPLIAAIKQWPLLTAVKLGADVVGMGLSNVLPECSNWVIGCMLVMLVLSVFVVMML
jgi:hypothetical protein